LQLELSCPAASARTTPASVGNPCNSSSNGYAPRCSTRCIACKRRIFGVELADARPAALLALASLAAVLADARPAALLALASLAVVLANARPAALRALASLAVVLADARPAALLALTSYAVVLADA
jgi:hypothetical protein